MSPITAEDKLSTIFFPLTANPAGNHHLLLVESVLQQLPETKLVVFLLSNGLHPDPFKHQKFLLQHYAWKFYGVYWQTGLILKNHCLHKLLKNPEHP